MQQRIQRTRRAATRTVQSGQFVKQAHRIKTVCAWIEEKNDRDCAGDCRSENDARENCQRWSRGGFYYRRNGLRFAAHDLLKLIGVDYDVRVAGCQRNQQKQKTGGGKNESGDGEAAAFVQLRALADLHERDDRKNEAEDIEWKSAATTNKCHRQNPENQTGGRKGICFWHLSRS